MSDPYGRAKGGRLTFKDGTLATRSKSIEKKKKKNKKKNKKPIGDYEIDPSDLEQLPQPEDSSAAADAGAGGGEAYTIDAAKKMKYEELFPVETKKFGYQPKKDFKSVEEALDDRVKKKADRYCK